MRLPLWIRADRITAQIDSLRRGSFLSPRAVPPLGRSDALSVFGYRSSFGFESLEDRTVPAFADLGITDFRIENETVRPGDVVTAHFRIANVGEGPTEITTSFAIHLATPTGAEFSDPILFEAEIPRLAPGASFQGTATFVLPPKLVAMPNLVTFIAVADRLNAVEEIVKTNNQSLPIVYRFGEPLLPVITKLDSWLPNIDLYVVRAPANSDVDVLIQSSLGTRMAWLLDHNFNILRTTVAAPGMPALLDMPFESSEIGYYVAVQSSDTLGGSYDIHAQVNSFALSSGLDFAGDVDLYPFSVFGITTVDVHVLSWEAPLKISLLDGFGRTLRTTIAAPGTLASLEMPFESPQFAYISVESLSEVGGRYDIQVRSVAGSGTPQRLYTGFGTKPISIASGDVNGDGLVDLVAANYVAESFNTPNGPIWLGNVSLLFGLGEGRFSSPVPVYVGAFPTSVALAEINGDGYLDLVTGNAGSQNITVFLGDGAGFFSLWDILPLATVPQDPSLPISLTIEDVNGDAILDIITTNHGSNSVSVFLGIENGGFYPERRLRVGINPRAVAIGDINGDGNADIITANSGSTNHVNVFGGADLSVLLGRGDGTFENEYRLHLADNPFTVALGDVNSDGFLDLVTSSFEEGKVSVSLGKGDGTFDTETIYDVGLSPGALKLADANQDGLLDIVTANRLAGTISLLAGRGDGSFDRARTFLVGFEAVDLMVGDMNGDGLADIITANGGSFEGLPVGNFAESSVSILFGMGDNKFLDRSRLSVGEVPQGAILADVNSDNRPDLIVANSGDNDVSVLLGRGDGTFAQERRFPVGDWPTSVAVGDLNRDGRMDIVTANAHSDDLSILLGLDDGNFVPLMSVPVAGAPTSVTLVDIDGDGLLDIVTANMDSDDIAILKGAGNGTFELSQRISVASGPFQVAVADLDADGLLDIITASGSFESYLFGSDNVPPPVVSTLLGQADGSFLVEQFAFGIDRGLGTFAIEDIDGDGLLDIAIPRLSVNMPGQSDVAILRRRLGGGFNVEAIGIGKVATFVGLADINGDNRLDLLAVGDSSNQVALFLGNGDGTFLASTWLVVQGFPFVALTEDLNGDGRLDIVTVNPTSQDVSVMLLLPNGSLVTFVLAPSDSIVTDVVSVDVDADGDEDVIALSTLGEVLVRLREPGGGFKTQVIRNELEINAFTVVDSDDRNGKRIAVSTIEGVSIYAFLPDGSVALQGSVASGLQPSSLAQGDFNQDGLVDLAIVNKLTFDLVFCFGQENGGFLQVGRVPLGTDPNRPRVTDIDQNGTLDVIVSHQLSSDVLIFLGAGDGTFTELRVTAEAVRSSFASHGWAQSLGETIDVVPGDYNEDGHVDLLALNAGEERLVLLQADALGNYAVEKVINPGGVPIIAEAGDYNSDGHLDLAVFVLEQDQRVVKIFIGTGNGEFVVRSILRVGQSTAFTTNDLNHDGILDLVLSNALGDVLELRGKGDGTFEKVTGRSVALAVADLDGDGKKDVVLSNEQRDRVSVQLGRTASTFEEVETLGEGNGLLGPGSVRLHDLDGDGLQDLIVANTGTNELLVFRGLAGAEFGEAQRYDVGTAPAGVTLEDLDGDGVVDIIVANQSSNDLSVLIGARIDGRWDVSKSLRVGNGLGSNEFFDAPVSTEVLDANGDGILDILVNNSGNGSLTLVPGANNGGFIPNDPSGFRSLSLTPAGPTTTGQLPGRIGDVNGDGRPDFVTALPASNSITFISDIATAFFAPDPRERYFTFSSLNLNRPRSLQLADVSRDGILDLVVGNSGDNRFSLILGGRDGLSFSHSFIVGELASISDFALVDTGNLVQLYAVALADQNVTVFDLVFANPRGGSDLDDVKQGKDDSGLTGDDAARAFTAIFARNILNGIFANLRTILGLTSTIFGRTADAKGSGADGPNGGETSGERRNPTHNDVAAERGNLVVELRESINNIIAYAVSWLNERFEMNLSTEDMAEFVTAAGKIFSPRLTQLIGLVQGLLKVAEQIAEDQDALPNTQPMGDANRRELPSLVEQVSMNGSTVDRQVCQPDVISSAEIDSFFSALQVDGLEATLIEVPTVEAMLDTNTCRESREKARTYDKLVAGMLGITLRLGRDRRTNRRLQKKIINLAPL